MEEQNTTAVEQESEAPKTYTEDEVNSLVSRAVNDSLKKAREKAAKSTDQRVAELEAELARRDNLDLTRKAMKEAGIPSELEGLFVGDGYSDKIETFNKWFEGAVDAAVKNKISSASPIHLATSDVKATKRRTLAEIEASL